MPEQNETVLWVFLHSWHAEGEIATTINDREASWGDVCEVLFIFQAINWIWRIFQADGEQK